MKTEGFRTQEYYKSTLLFVDGPRGRQVGGALSALCPDGKRRNAHCTGDGFADTFYSIPAFVYVRRHRIHGWISVERSASGENTTIIFRPDSDRPHADLVGG